MSFSDQVKKQIDIVAVIGSYVELKKRGRDFLGLCPFHSEKSPSFMVNQKDAFYYCFGCHQGGDVFKFMQNYNGSTFKEALKDLCQRFSIPLPKELTFSKGQSKKAFNQQEKLRETMLLSTDQFKDDLKKQGGKPALSYLHNRGIEDKSIQFFNLGYFAKSVEAFCRNLTNKGVFSNNLADLGVAYQKNGRFWSNFSGRLIFPIQNEKGHVLSFGGRALPPQDKEVAKYLNGKTSPLYDKKQELYGFYQARPSMVKSKEAIVVEGYLDVIKMSQYGFENTLAVCGTALTPEHISRLKRYVKKIVLLLDGDKAGIQAALKAVPILMAEEIESAIALLPKGEDPDSFLGGPDENKQRLKQIIDQAPSPFYFFTTHYSEDLRNSEKGPALINSMVEYISKVPDLNKREIYLKDLSYGETKIDPKRFMAIPKNKKAIQMEQVQKINRKNHELDQVFIHLTKYPEAWDIYENEEIIDLFSDFPQKNWIKLFFSCKDLFEFLTELENREEKSNYMLKYNQFVFDEEDSDQFVIDTVKNIRTKKLKKQVQQLQSQIEKNLRDGNEQTALDLMGQKSQIQRQFLK